MKKKLIMMLAMLACMSASAQVKFGAKVGLDLTNFWGNDAHEKKAPAPRCNIYFLRSDFPNTTLETGDEVKFRILKLGSARNLPFVYFWDRLYYKCIVEPV